MTVATKHAQRTPARIPFLTRLWNRAPVPQRKSATYYDASGASARAYLVAPGQAVWMERDYARFAQEAYMRNVIAHRAVQMVAQSASSMPLLLYTVNARGQKRELKSHALLKLLAQPNPAQAGTALFESIYCYRLLSGNAFVHAVGPNAETPREFHVLRPDRVAVIAGRGGMPSAYRYTVGQQSRDYRIDPVTWRSRVLHIRQFHPLNDWYGLSPVEAAAMSIDQHNHSSAWNQALLQNGARPSGALIVKSEHSGGATLTEEQFTRIRAQVDEQFSGSANAGRPLLLEGGLEWKELSLSPRDMDFTAMRAASAREIALAFGVPPQLLGIPGDNTYSNLQEARLALWEQTVLPLVSATLSALSPWLSQLFNNHFVLEADTDAVPALAARNQLIWDRVERASFLSDEEKRAAVGYGKRDEF